MTMNRQTIVLAMVLGAGCGDASNLPPSSGTPNTNEISAAGRSVLDARVAIDASASDADGGATGVGNGRCSSHVVLSITGATCGSCKSIIEARLLSLPGIESAVMSLMTLEVRVTYCASKVTPRDMTRAIEAIGYGAQAE